MNWEIRPEISLLKLDEFGDHCGGQTLGQRLTLCSFFNCSTVFSKSGIRSSDLVHRSESHAPVNRSECPALIPFNQLGLLGRKLRESAASSVTNGKSAAAAIVR